MQLELIEMIREQSGTAATSGVQQVVRISLFLAKSPFKLTVRAMKALKYDYGKAFEFSSVVSHQRSHQPTRAQLVSCGVTLRCCVSVLHVPSVALSIVCRLCCWCVAGTGYGEGTLSSSRKVLLQ